MADTIVMPTRARQDALDAKRLNYLNALQLHLYKNNYTPVVGSVAGDFTEATFPGYASQGPITFGAVTLNASNNGECDSAVYTFTCTGVPAGGTQDIYGWYTTWTGGVVGPAARFAAPVPLTLSGAGQSISIQILFEDGGLA